MRSQSHPSSRRRAARTIAAAAAIGIGHLAALLILNTSVPRPGPQAPAHADFVARLEPRQPARPAPPPRRSRRPAPLPPVAAPPVAAARPLHQPPPQTSAAPALAAPGPPGYGRWTVAPGSGPAQATGLAPGLNLAGCTPSALPTLTGAAHEACARRLSETAKSAPALPPTGYQRNAQEQYAQAVRDWKLSPAMTPHPCPPQDVAAHKLYFDKCSLVNAARAAGGPVGSSPAIKLEFKMKF